MFTLKDLSEAMWSITQVDIRVYTEEPKLFHKWMFGPDIYETYSMFHERIEGTLTIVDKKINYYGDSGSRGPETGWGLKTKEIPELLLNAPIRHLGLLWSHSGEYHVSIDVTLPDFQIEILRGELEREKEKEEQENRELVNEIQEE